MAGKLTDGRGVPEWRLFGLYALVLVTRGQGHFRDEVGFACALEPGDLLLLFPEVEHRYGPARGEYWDETFVVFEGAVFDLWRAEGVLRPERPHYRLGRAAYWQGRLSEAFWHPTQPGRAASLSRLCRLQALLAEMLEQGAPGRDKETWSARAFALLEGDPGGPTDYRALSAELGMSYEAFRKRFAKEVGVSPGRYLRQRRIQLACRMLLQQSVPVKHISFELGFHDEFHFSRQFKKTVGMAPTAFRKLFK